MGEQSNGWSDSQVPKALLDCRLHPLRRLGVGSSSCERHCGRPYRYLNPDYASERKRSASLCVAGINRPRTVSDTDRQLSSMVVEAPTLFEQVPWLSDALFDLFSGRLCHPWHIPNSLVVAASITRMHSSAPIQRSTPILSSPSPRHEEHTHHHQILSLVDPLAHRPPR